MLCGGGIREKLKDLAGCYIYIPSSTRMITPQLLHFLHNKSKGMGVASWVWLKETCQTEPAILVNITYASYIRKKLQEKSSHFFGQRYHNCGEYCWLYTVQLIRLKFGVKLLHLCDVMFTSWHQKSPSNDVNLMSYYHYTLETI